MSNPTLRRVEATLAAVLVLACLLLALVSVFRGDYVRSTFFLVLVLVLRPIQKRTS